MILPTSFFYEELSSGFHTVNAWYWGKGISLTTIGDRIWGMQNFELQGKDPERIQMNYNLLDRSLSLSLLLHGIGN